MKSREFATKVYVVSNPLLFYIPFLTEIIPSVGNASDPFHMPSLELCIPLNYCKCTVKIWINHKTRPFTQLFSQPSGAINENIVQNHLNIALVRDGSTIFFRSGCTRLLLYFNTNKPHRFFFYRIPVVLENRRSSQGGGGGAHPLHLPLDPPLLVLNVL